MDQLLNRLSNPSQVRALFDILQQGEKDTLGLKKEFAGRIIFDFAPQVARGSVGLEKVWKMPVQVPMQIYPPPMPGQPWPTETRWEVVGNEPSTDVDFPTDFVKYLFEKACEHPWFAEQIANYYGQTPVIEV